MIFFRKPPNNTDDFSISRWFCPQRTTINSAIGKWTVLELSGKYQRKIPSVILFLINMINSVHSLPMNLLTDFTDRIYSVGNSVGKNYTSSFFLLCFKFFSHCNSLGIYRGNISIGKSLKNLPMEIFPRYFRLYLSILG